MGLSLYQSYRVPLRGLPRFSRNRCCEDPGKASAYDSHPAICVP